jgi:hypothetical protein
MKDESEAAAALGRRSQSFRNAKLRKETAKRMVAARLERRRLLRTSTAFAREMARSVTKGDS